MRGEGLKGGWGSELGIVGGWGLELGLMGTWGLYLGWWSINFLFVYLFFTQAHTQPTSPAVSSTSPSGSQLQRRGSQEGAAAPSTSPRASGGSRLLSASSTAAAMAAMAEQLQKLEIPLGPLAAEARSAGVPAAVHVCVWVWLSLPVHVCM